MAYYLGLIVGPAGIEPAACGLADNRSVPAWYQMFMKY
jgi:hypothetical protein